MESVIRLPLPSAYLDPAFVRCLHECVAERELVLQFERMYGGHLMEPSRTKVDMQAFAEFVHDCVYMRLPDEAIESLRVTPAEAA
ncbi:hypothetical protein [Achromobacter denitrificans]|uniref:hypothetical protein n=1 Tax=Achromobacter denitrificans TaxID=32002 RepID=UPI001467211B|nr:hypothetical protein [Achromobacter denitrificans]CAB3812194.1 hypothetical protein LMG1860_00455 [Achromobacter denitrificans]